MKSGVSLCTYTYNDGEFVNELLRRVRGWSVRPDEIVVLDDGSDSPFVPDDGALPARVVRLERNRGIPVAKHTGISSARGEYILSVDCDVRIDSDWLEKCLPIAQREDVGLVGGAVVHGSGQDAVSRYLRLYGDNHNVGWSGDVDFIPGNAFLLRRETWEEVKGFSGFTESVCEDHLLCNRLKDRGYVLWSESGAVARQIRRLKRSTMCKRVWLWCHKAVKSHMAHCKRVAPFIVEIMAKPLLKRMEYSAGIGDLALIYLDILYYTFIVADLLDHAETKGKSAHGTRKEFVGAVASMFKGYPLSRTLFRKDMLELGRVLPKDGDAVHEEVVDCFSCLGALIGTGFMDWLEREVILALMHEDEETLVHFSAYDQAEFDVE